MAYADYTYYKDAYMGNILSEEEFPRLAERADERVDYLTGYKAAQYFADHADDKYIKHAVCAIAEILAQAEYGNALSGSTDGANIQTEIVGKHHITYAAPMNTASQEGQRAIDKQIRRAAYTYLLPTGLLYGGREYC